MTNWIDITNFGMISAGLMIAVLSLIVTRVIKYLDKWEQKFFSIFFCILTCYLASDLLGQISLVLLGSEYGALSKFLIFMESLSSSMISLMVLHYVLHCVDEPTEGNKYFILSGISWIVYVVLLLLTQFTTFIYYVTEDNVYHRGPYYPILLVPIVIIMLINILAIYTYRERLSPRELLAFSTYVIIPLVCIILNMIFYSLLFIPLGTSVALFFMFVIIFYDSTDSYVAQVSENAKALESIRILEMRPHFIYNTLTSIYYLCGQDPKKAQKLIMDFTNYLRKNFGALAKDDTIPFTDELEHAREYLAVEQVRFEGSLYIETDTPHTMFRLPPLTLQPIVENAVKHGISPELPPLIITIRTEKKDGISIVTVEDTGPGMDSTKDNDEGIHIALDNIRTRLVLMCHGKLSITDRIGGGTVVTLEIPD